ncbi:MAG: hypothetical protein WBI44_00190 [Syntrophaceticus sp.]
MNRGMLEVKLCGPGQAVQREVWFNCQAVLSIVSADASKIAASLLCKEPGQAIYAITILV